MKIGIKDKRAWLLDTRGFSEATATCISIFHCLLYLTDSVTPDSFSCVRITVIIHCKMSARPEDVYKSFIQDVYPNRHTQAYFLPPIHFKKVPFTVQQIEGHDVVVYEHKPPAPNPGGRRRRRPPPPPAPPAPQMATGSLFTAPPPGMLSRRVQDSDLMDDEGQEKVEECLRALADSNNEVMMVISALEFRHMGFNITWMTGLILSWRPYGL